MSSTPDTSLIPDAVREAAAEWHVRLGGDAAGEADWLAFEQWLAKDSRHLAAYEAVEQVWQDLDAAPAGARSNVAPFRRPSRRGAVGWIAAAVAGLAAASVMVGVYLPGPAQEQILSAPLGERRTYDLQDGTHVILNGGSRLSVSMSRRERKVVMADAEAVFDVAHEANRPFVIDAGDRQVRVLGTEFSVLNHAGLVSVTVRRGLVEVRPAQGQPGRVARLAKGQSLIHRAAGGDEMRRVDPDLAFAWTQGRLVFQDTPLEEVADTLSRYTGKPVTVAPEARRMPVTAVLSIKPGDDMVRDLTAFLPLEATRRTDGVLLSQTR